MAGQAGGLAPRDAGRPRGGPARGPELGREGRVQSGIRCPPPPPPAAARGPGAMAVCGEDASSPAEEEVRGAGGVARGSRCGGRFLGSVEGAGASSPGRRPVSLQGASSRYRGPGQTPPPQSVIRDGHAGHLIGAPPTSRPFAHQKPPSRRWRCLSLARQGQQGGEATPRVLSVRASRACSALRPTSHTQAPGPPKSPRRRGQFPASDSEVRGPGRGRGRLVGSRQPFPGRRG